MLFLIIDCRKCELSAFTFALLYEQANTDLVVESIAASPISPAPPPCVAVPVTSIWEWFIEQLKDDFVVVRKMAGHRLPEVDGVVPVWHG